MDGRTDMVDDSMDGMDMTCYSDSHRHPVAYL